MRRFRRRLTKAMAIYAFAMSVGFMLAFPAVGALVSDGIKIGVKTGFDSGSTLDYVYENKPRGLGPGGRLIDKVFLEAIGWRGIRQRKLHLQELIEDGLRAFNVERIHAGEVMLTGSDIFGESRDVAMLRLKSLPEATRLAGGFG